MFAPGTYPNTSCGRKRSQGIHSFAHLKFPQSVPLTLQFLSLGLSSAGRNHAMWAGGFLFSTENQMPVAGLSSLLDVYYFPSHCDSRRYWASVELKMDISSWVHFIDLGTGGKLYCWGLSPWTVKIQSKWTEQTSPLNSAQKSKSWKM